MIDLTGPTPWEIRWELRFLDGEVRSGISHRYAYDTRDSVIAFMHCAHRYGWGDFASFKDEALATSQLVILSIERAKMPTAGLWAVYSQCLTALAKASAMAQKRQDVRFDTLRDNERPAQPVKNNNGA